MHDMESVAKVSYVALVVPGLNQSYSPQTSIVFNTASLKDPYNHETMAESLRYVLKGCEWLSEHLEDVVK